jgi:hypothetical protein
VVYLLKARTVGPGKQPLLANGSKTAFAFRQRLAKHVPAAMDVRATIVLLLEMAFFTQSVQRGYREDSCDNQVNSVWESEEKSPLEGSCHSERT